MLVKMTAESINDYSQPNEGFVVFGRILPKYENSQWQYTEELFAEPYIKHYDDEELDISYVNDPDKAVYLYYERQACIGRIKLCANWNGFALIEDIAVAKDGRQKGIGTLLMNKAIEWAKQQKLLGLMLETQDINVAACRFYAKNGFQIGGVDTMLYTKFFANEMAVFWYYKF